MFFSVKLRWTKTCGVWLYGWFEHFEFRERKTTLAKTEREQQHQLGASHNNTIAVRFTPSWGAFVVCFHADAFDLNHIYIFTRYTMNTCISYIVYNMFPPRIMVQYLSHVRWVFRVSFKGPPCSIFPLPWLLDKESYFPQDPGMPIRKVLLQIESCSKDWNDWNPKIDHIKSGFWGTGDLGIVSKTRPDYNIGII